MGIRLAFGVEVVIELEAVFLDCGCELFACTLGVAVAEAALESEELLK